MADLLVLFVCTCAIMKGVPPAQTMAYVASGMPGLCYFHCVTLCHIIQGTWIASRGSLEEPSFIIGTNRGLSQVVGVTRRKLQTPGNAEEHKRQETPTINPMGPTDKPHRPSTKHYRKDSPGDA